MCRMLGVICNDEDLLGCAVHQVRDALRCPEATRHDGIGIGYYSGDEPLLKKRPSSEGEKIEYTELLKGIRSKVVLVHVRQATVGSWKDRNTHPFRFRKWLFAHIGHLPALQDNRQKLLERIPEFLSRNVRGDTDSELAFHLFLEVLFKEGKLNELDMPAEKLGEFLRQLAVEVNGLHEGPEKPKMAVIITNGRIMAALSQGVSIHYSFREGILDCNVHEPTQQNKQTHALFRGIMIGAAMDAPGHQWREIPDGSIIHVSNMLEMKVEHL